MDSELLAERGIPARVVDGGGLLLPAGYLSAKEVAAGEVIGIGLGADGLRVGVGIDLDDRTEGVAGLARGLRAALAERAGESVELDTAVWTACAQVPGLFCTALPAMRSIRYRCSQAQPQPQPHPHRISTSRLYR
jgi:hypothetical protein